ncbi:peptide-methionine (S)-S-oxide reductase MsrA [Oecophyllibacter saccharovorans]|uniref:Peptide methionine sulfoxide reductase MsrA n=1 Tax=Oecophyllibacter saccharovorans TaxID=2558360 RepID=A0A506UQK3_9PROT|nr:peptide-methionine (S)-S-oxide reductase MsrA [Oecophyllibacter saccharovorans]TPW35645.1 peptide-methionine (S)-S-oxide reductase MsrA [Oecophyllibacter saccharovorans]
MTNTSSILLGGGCFWCIEAILKDLKGVLEVTPGYAGGTTERPTYEQVCTDRTGHAEVVKVVFDETQLPLKDLLRIFFTIHDPTQLNRQGGDIGRQYRSVIFGDEGQRRQSHEVMKEIENKEIWPAPLVTEVEGETAFWPAEAKHKDYFTRNPDTAYCAAVVAPKVAKARNLYRKRLKKPTSTPTA